MQLRSLLKMKEPPALSKNDSSRKPAGSTLERKPKKSLVMVAIVPRQSVIGAGYHNLISTAAACVNHSAIMSTLTTDIAARCKQLCRSISAPTVVRGTTTRAEM